MINHARTLLLNLDQPLDLPEYLQAVRRVLFGKQPDLTMLTYRVQQYLTILHATELEQFVLALDPRITYNVDSTLQYPGEFGIAVTGDSQNDITILGDLEPPDVMGLCDQTWTVDVIDGTRVRVRRARRPAADDTYTYTTDAGLSSPVTLTGSPLQVQFRPVNGAHWTITTRSRPTSNLGQIVSTLRLLSDPVFAPLFGVTDGRSASEPFATFKALWDDHPELPYQLGGVLLALIYDTEAIRTRA